MTQPQGAPASGMGQLELEFAGFHEGYLSRYIQLADTKAGTALVVVAATLGYLLGLDKFVSALCLHGTWPTSGLAIATSLLLGVAGAASFAVIAPRGSPPGNGLVYWEDVAGRTRDQFVADVGAAGADGLAKDRLRHTYVLSTICRRKYQVLRAALWAGGLGLCSALACRLIL